MDVSYIADHVLLVKYRNLGLQPFLKFDVFGIYLVFQNSLCLILQLTHLMQFFIFFVLKVLDPVMHLQYLLSPHPFMLTYFLTIQWCIPRFLNSRSYSQGWSLEFVVFSNKGTHGLLPLLEVFYGVFAVLVISVISQIRRCFSAQRLSYNIGAIWLGEVVDWAMGFSSRLCPSTLSLNVYVHIKW